MINGLVHNTFYSSKHYLSFSLLINLRGCSDASQKVYKSLDQAMIYSCRQHTQQVKRGVRRCLAATIILPHIYDQPGD
jgi:hypothetical protein